MRLGVWTFGVLGFGVAKGKAPKPTLESAKVKVWDFRLLA